MEPPRLDIRMNAAIKMIERTGAQQFQLRYCAEEDPTIWVASASYEHKHPLGVASTVWEVAAGMRPEAAILRLCEQLIDGGVCQHCKRLTVFVPDADDDGFEALGCVYAWDPELETFRRSCEGEN